MFDAAWIPRRNTNKRISCIITSQSYNRRRFSSYIIMLYTWSCYNNRWIRPRRRRWWWRRCSIAWTKTINIILYSRVCGFFFSKKNIYIFFYRWRNTHILYLLFTYNISSNHMHTEWLKSQLNMIIYIYIYRRHNSIWTNYDVIIVISYIKNNVGVDVLR